MAKPKEPADDAGVLIELGVGDKGKEDTEDYSEDASFMMPAKKAVGSEEKAKSLKEAIEACLEAHGLLKASPENMDEETTSEYED